MGDRNGGQRAREEQSKGRLGEDQHLMRIAMSPFRSSTRAKSATHRPLLLQLFTRAGPWRGIQQPPVASAQAAALWMRTGCRMRACSAQR